MKFQRTYQLLIEKYNASVNQSNGLPEKVSPYTYLEVPNDLTIEFDITRTQLSQSQTCTIKIYNLAKENRESIFKDSWDRVDARGVMFYAGYAGEPLSLIFRGLILECQSYREQGSTNNITELKAIQTGTETNNAYTPNGWDGIFPAGTSATKKILRLAKDIPGVQNAMISLDYDGIISRRSETVSGGAWEYLRKITNNKVCLDNGTLLALHDQDVLNLTIEIDSSVLLGSPKRSQTFVTYDMLFEPRLMVDIQVDLKSSSNSYLNKNQNQLWKVLGFSHKGSISPAVDNKCITSVTLWDGGGATPTLRPIKKTYPVSDVP